MRPRPADHAIVPTSSEDVAQILSTVTQSAKSNYGYGFGLFMVGLDQRPLAAGSRQRR
jgi:hypothetical protein